MGALGIFGFLPRLRLCYSKICSDHGDSPALSRNCRLEGISMYLCAARQLSSISMSWFEGVLFRIAIPAQFTRPFGCAGFQNLI
jgi:hypothetical protein